MDIVCTPVVTENVINITGSGGSQAGGALGRRRRDSEEGRAFRTKRGAVRYKMTEMNCTEVEGEPLPPPSFVVSVHNYEGEREGGREGESGGSEEYCIAYIQVVKINYHNQHKQVITRSIWHIC